MTDELKVFAVGDKMVTDFKDEMFLIEDREGAKVLMSLYEIATLFNKAVDGYPNLTILKGE